jgi:hypothetical protein
MHFCSRGQNEKEREAAKKATKESAKQQQPASPGGALDEFGDEGFRGLFGRNPGKSGSPRLR